MVIIVLYFEKIRPAKEFNIFFYLPCHGRRKSQDVDLTEPALHYQSTSQMAIAAAIYMGFSEIYLVGFDHNWLCTKEISPHFYEERAGVDKATAVDALIVQLQRLLDANARHILVMPPIERSGGSFASQTVAFANDLSGKLYNLLLTEPYKGNPIIAASGPNPALLSNFNIYTSYPTYGEFAASTQVAYCPTPTVLTGCSVSDGDGTTYATRMFADDYNLTPAGNRWVALQLYSAMAQGWR